MSLTPIIPNPDDLKRTMGSQPPMMPPIGKQGEPPPEPGLGSLGAMPPLSSVNTQGMGKLQPIVTNPRQQQEQDLQSKISGYENQAKPQGFWQNLRHGLAKTAEIAGSIYAPEVVAQIPGTRLHEQQQQRQLAGLQNQDVTMQDAASKRNLEGAQAQYYGAHAQAIGNHEVTPEEAAAMGNPDLAGSLMDPKAWEQLIKQSGINDTKVQTTGMTTQSREDISAANNLTKEKVAALKPEQRDDHAIRLMEIPPNQRSQHDNAYLAAYSKWVDQTKTQPGVARAQAFGMFRPVQTIDPATGDVHYDFAGSAIKSGASSPQSMNFRTAVGMSKFMTSGKGGQTITAYNTANDHLELLGKAMDALQNGDTQAINQMSNAFKQQFGQAAPTNVNAVKAMLAGELANVAKVTGATDPEIQEQRDNLNRANSPEQIKGFMDTNHELMDQKAYEMYQQYQQGEQGRPAFNTGLTGRGVGNTAPKQGGTGMIRAIDDKGVLHEAPAGTPLPKGWKAQ